ncbi:MAG: DUF1826 domain-containing protein [Zetaproteobacteria bacterium]|nr:DUF1826 domain-containing protein [Zetaproteobacteria bacterium]
MNSPAVSEEFCNNDSEVKNNALFTEERIDLTAIYQDFVSLCIWQPSRNKQLEQYAYELALGKFEFKQLVTIDSVSASLDLLPNGEGKAEMKEWIADLVETFATLFGLEQVGLRIAGRETPMCPSFHVDHVPTRLIHPLCGEGCEWFADPLYFKADIPDETHLKSWVKEAQNSQREKINQAPVGSVVIMKGTRWDKGCYPVIHRSPKHDQPRLVMTLDFA